MPFNLPCDDIMELIGTHVEQIRSRANYTKCMEELIHIRDKIIDRGFIVDWDSPILKSIDKRPYWTQEREWYNQEIDYLCCPMNNWVEDEVESIYGLWYFGCSGDNRWSNTPEQLGFNPTPWDLVYSIDVFKWGNIPNNSQF